jgi:hypothetical protein
VAGSAVNPGSNRDRVPPPPPPPPPPDESARTLKPSQTITYLLLLFFGSPFYSEQYDDYC